MSLLKGWLNILDRYFLREFFKPFGVCLFAFLLLMLIHDLSDNITDFIEAKTRFRQILHYYGILLPAWIVSVMPITLLLSLLYAVSSMSKHGEVTAMRASGLPIIRLMTPYGVVGVCVSLQMLALSMGWAPDALQKAKELFEKSTQKPEAAKRAAVGVTYNNFAANRFWTIGFLNLSEQRAKGIEITQYDDRGRDLRKFSATDGFYKQGFWTLQNIIIYDYTLPAFHTNSLRQVERIKAREFTESPSRFILEAKKTKRMTTHELLESLRHADHLPAKQRSMYSTEFHGRLSLPIANFVVFLIGIPFAVTGQRRSNFMAIVNALAFFFVYLFLTHVMTILGNSGRAPAWIAAWLPNGLFALAGLWMIRKIR